MSLDVSVAFTRLLFHYDSARAGAAWNRDRGYTGERERFQKPQRLGQITKAFTKKNLRRPCTKGIRAN